MKENDDTKKNLNKLLEEAQKMQLRIQLLEQIISTAINHGLTDLRKDLPKFSTVEQLRNVDLALKNASCIEAIKDGRVTINNLAEMDVHDLEQALEHDDYPTLGKTLK